MQDNGNKRIDAEYFKKEFLNFFKNIPNLRNLSEFVKDGYRVVYENTKVVEKEVAQDKNYPIFLQATDLSTPFIGTDNLSYVDNQDWDRYPKGGIKSGEILIEVKGKVEKVAIVPNDFPKKTLVSGSLYKMTVNEKISKYILLTYLISKYGTAFKNRYKTNLLISFISKPDLYRIPVPNFSSELQNKIDEIFVKIFDSKKQSEILYKEAETLLLENLGLQNFQSTNQSVNIKALKDSFLQTGRLDAEFYRAKYDELENLFNRFERIKLADLVNYPISSGITPKANGDDYTDKENGIAFIRAVDLQNGEVNLDNVNYIKPNIHQTTLKRTQLKPNDVLISIAGTVGRCALFTYDMQANINQAVAILRFDENKINRLYLVVFFNSELGKQYIAKYARQGLQTNLNLTEIGELSIPIPDIKTQTQIAEFVRQSNELREQATQLLAQAKYSVEAEIEQSALQERERERERELLDESDYYLRLAEWVLLESLLLGQPKNISVQSFSQSFGISGRLDAEYYQPKFERLLQKLKQYRHKTLGELVDLQKSVEVGSENYRDEGLPFVRVADFSKFGISQTDKFVSPVDFADIIRPKKDTILLSKDGTVGIAYCVPSDLEVITSGAIVHLSLKTDEILPDYLALVLNSEAVQLQAQRDAGGSIIQHWKPSEILEVVIPVLPKEIQQVVSDKVQMSFELKNQSEILLEQAKILVENEIENGMHATP
ncbi:restriction endonuclease subunit S [Moraxella bovis]|uniref:restriction endonuclease subunit S n=1 Tax=Moraxella bovis TaxID=476 RepID=UPI002226EC49|nr:restriction endonuclease subunit S [Moraxella bovis]UZA16234.1 restriction endonuclease subunit S [Moraxella bovis]